MRCFEPKLRSMTARLSIVGDGDTFFSGRLYGDRTIKEKMVFIKYSGIFEFNGSQDELTIKGH